MELIDATTTAAHVHLAISALFLIAFLLLPRKAKYRPFWALLFCATLGVAVRPTEALFSGLFEPWLIAPIALVVAQALTIFVFYRSEFFSNARKS